MEVAEVSESTPVDVGPAADGGVDESNLSADAILDRHTEPRETGEAQAEAGAQAVPAEAKPSEDKTGQEQAEQKEEETPEPFIKEPEPEVVKKAFKALQKGHPEVAKQLRNWYYENKSYREVFTVPEARQMRELFATADEAQLAKNSTADLMAVDEYLHKDPGALLSHIQSRDPQAFMNLARSVPEALYRTNPALYRAEVSEPAVRNYHQFFENKARETGNQDVLTAIEILRDFERQTIGGAPGRGAQPYQADPRMVSRLNQLEAERAQAVEQSSATFRNAVDADFDAAVAGEVSKIVERSGADISDAAKEEISQRVLSDAKDRLLADEVLQLRLGRSLQQGRRDGQHRQELTSFLTANAKRFIPQSVSQHMNWITKEIMKANATSLDKAAKVQATKNVSGATPGSGGKQPLTKEQIDKLSDNELFEAAANGLL